MVQSIFGLGLKGTGIIAVLIVAGIILKITNTSAGTGDLAISGGVIIGLLLGLLGVVAVVKRVVR
jgi:hypothetical protein